MADVKQPIMSLQDLINQANQLGQPANMSVPPQAGMSGAPPANMSVIGSQEVPPPTPAPPTPQAHLPALSAYVQPPDADQVQLDAYRKQADKAVADQGLGLDSLQKYIDKVSQKPEGLAGVNWTPLAAYIDSQMPGSKMTEAAKAIAPMNPEERDKMLFGLQQQLQSGRATLSKEQLDSLGQQIKMRQDQAYRQAMLAQTATQHAAERNHWANQDQNALLAATGRNGRVETMKDNQTAAAVDKVVNDKQLLQHSQRINGADRILNQLDNVADGKIVGTNQLLNDVNEEYLSLLKGQGNGALGHLERTEYTSAKAKLAAVQQMITANPQSINSPEIMKQLRTSVEELKAAYNKAYDFRAQDLSRKYKYNPEATRQMGEKIETMRGRFGLLNQTSPNGAGDGTTKEWGGKTWKIQNGHWVVQ